MKGLNVMSGYYNDKEETDRSFVDGYYKTGDIGYLNGDILYVTGRKKNLITLKNGKNFSPEAIERELLRLPYVKECLVTAENRNSVDVVVAKILPEGDAGQLKNDLETINRSFPAYMRIGDHELVTREFKKTNTKKIIRN